MNTESLKERIGATDIDIEKIVMSLLHKWWLIVLCGALAAGGMLFYTVRYIQPMYRASVMIYVNNSTSASAAGGDVYTSLSTAQRLVSTYINMITSDTVLEKVADASETNLSASQLRGMITASQVTETELFRVYVKSGDPERAAYIANIIAEVAPGEIERFVQGSSTRVIDYAKVPSTPSSPDVKRNTMMGGIFGVAFAIICILIASLSDVRLKEEADLEALSDLPILGRIPDFDSVNQRKGKKKGYYGTYAKASEEAQNGEKDGK